MNFHLTQKGALERQINVRVFLWQRPGCKSWHRTCSCTPATLCACKVRSRRVWTVTRTMTSPTDRVTSWWPEWRRSWPPATIWRRGARGTGGLGLRSGWDGRSREILGSSETKGSIKSLWRSWQSGRIGFQRYAVWMPSNFGPILFLTSTQMFSIVLVFKVAQRVRIHLAYFKNKIYCQGTWKIAEIFWFPFGVRLVHGRLYFLIFSKKTKFFNCLSISLDSLFSPLLSTIACLASNKHEHVTLRYRRPKELAPGSTHVIM